MGLAGGKRGLTGKRERELADDDRTVAGDARGLADDDRGQAIQVGAVLLFAVLILAFASYQAFVVPSQNRQVEFDHSRTVQGQLQDLRNAIVSVPGGGNGESTSVTLGARYPSRAVALNPEPPSGSLRTLGTTDPSVTLALTNATATGETGDVWNGSTRQYSTGGLAYEPNYNLYRNAPTTVYENTVLYDAFENRSLTLANQTLIRGRDISIVTLDGSMHRTTSGTVSVDVRALSTAERTIQVRAQGPSDPITLNVTTRLSATRWARLLADQPHVTDVRPAPDADSVPDPFTRVQIVLETGPTYTLQMTGVGVGTSLGTPSAAYLADVSGEGDRITRGDRAEIVLEVRDRYNNPVSGVTVNGSVAPGGAGSLDDGTRATNDDGRVTFTYNTTDTTPTGTHAVQFSLGGIDGAFDGTTGENATVNVTVQRPPRTTANGSAPINVTWSNPDGVPDNAGADLTACSGSSCRWDVGSSDDGTIRLNATADPRFEGVSTDFAVNNSTVATISPDQAVTGQNGLATTELTARENGTIGVLAAGGGSGDRIDVRVVNVTGPSGVTLRMRVEDVSNQDQDRGWYVISYEVTGSTSDVDRVSVLARNTNDGTDNWDNSTAMADTRTILDNNGGGDPFDLVVTARNASGDPLASATISDSAADARNASGNQVLGGGTPSFDSFQIVDQSSNRGPAYSFQYTVTSNQFGQVRAFLVSQEANGGGYDNTTVGSSAGSGTLSTYGQTTGNPDQFKVVLLLYDDRGVVTDTAVFIDAADGSGQRAG